MTVKLERTKDEKMIGDGLNANTMDSCINIQ